MFVQIKSIPSGMSLQGVSQIVIAHTGKLVIRNPNFPRADLEIKDGNVDDIRMLKAATGIDLEKIAD